MDSGYSFGVMKMLIEVVFAQHYECNKCNFNLHFEMVKFMLYEFHLN